MTESIVTSDPGIKGTLVLRRYIDLPKLLDLLHSKSLYFRRADGFADRLEGALFPGLRKLLDEEYIKGSIKYDSNEFYKRVREDNYVSCWTIGAKDNMALWQLYGGSKSSIVITSTLDRLFDNAFNWNRSIHIHKVKYVEHKLVRNYIIGAPRELLQFKNDAYKFEKELRIVMPHMDSDNKSLGIRLPLKNLDSLIRSVVVSPDADSDFVKAVTDLCKRYGLKSPVRRSKLSFVSI
jgi:hypothetical protein